MCVVAIVSRSLSPPLRSGPHCPYVCLLSALHLAPYASMALTARRVTHDDALSGAVITRSCPAICARKSVRPPQRSHFWAVNPSGGVQNGLARMRPPDLKLPRLGLRSVGSRFTRSDYVWTVIPKNSVFVELCKNFGFLTLFCQNDDF